MRTLLLIAPLILLFSLANAQMPGNADKKQTSLLLAGHKGSVRKISDTAYWNVVKVGNRWVRRNMKSKKYSIFVYSRDGYQISEKEFFIRNYPEYGTGDLLNKNVHCETYGDVHICNYRMLAGQDCNFEITHTPLQPFSYHVVMKDNDSEGVWKTMDSSVVVMDTNYNAIRRNRYVKSFMPVEEEVTYSKNKDYQVLKKDSRGNPTMYVNTSNPEEPLLHYVFYEYYD
jgi:hypothetical protein